MVQATSQLEVAQAKLEDGQAKLDAERAWLTEQQRALANDQATLAAWRSDQVRAWLCQLGTLTPPPCYHQRPCRKCMNHQTSHHSLYACLAGRCARGAGRA